MASVTQSKSGCKILQFYDGIGERRTIRIGKMSMRDADRIKTKIEELNTARISGTALSVETAAWLADRPDTFYAKLANVGLAVPRTVSKKPSATLEAFIDSYVSKRTDVKPATKEIWGQGKKGLIDFFGATRPLDQVTAGLAADYKSKMLADGLAPYTISKRLQFANKIFNAAVDHELIVKNPFAKVKIKKTMADRKHFITADDTDKLLEVAPDQDWRLIIVLARFGGLRTPSEVLSIKWADIDWAESKVKVTSPKTEHHEGKAFRMIPLFPELRAEFERARQAEPESEYLVNPKYRRGSIGPNGWRNCNLRTTFQRIVKRAGLKPWPRLFHNLRSSRQTELTEILPTHVVCAWLGNSEKIANKHYNQVTPDHFERAIRNPAGQNNLGFEKALRNALRSSVISDGTASHPVTQSVEIPEGNQIRLNSKTQKRRGWDSNPWWAVTPTPI
jgi:integrase